MADIFRIKTLDACLEVGGTQHKIVDPSYGTKNLLFSKAREIEKSREIDPDGYIDKLRRNNIEMIHAYIPSMPVEELEKLGSGYLTALIQHLSKLSEDNFGAVVEKVEKKPEAQA